MLLSLSEDMLANPYRVIGLPAGAGQNDIDLAVRRMRIWKSPADIPPTPWDFPQFGPVPREKADLERAVGLLMNPATRLVARAWWFTALPGELNTVAAKTAPAAGVSLRALQAHDKALTCLFDLAKKSPDVSRNHLSWCAALATLGVSLRAEDYLRWSAGVEVTGAAEGFEKAASPQEIMDIPQSWALALLPKLRNFCHNAYDASAFDQSVAFIRLAQQTSRDHPEAMHLRSTMLELMERNLLINCPRVQNFIYHGIPWKRWEKIFVGRKSRQICRQAEQEIEQTLLPLYRAFIKLQAPEYHDTRAVQIAFNAMVRNMAVGWSHVGATANARRWGALLQSESRQPLTVGRRLLMSLRSNRVSWTVLGVIILGVASNLFNQSPRDTYFPPRPYYNPALPHAPARQNMLSGNAPQPAVSDGNKAALPSYIRPRASPPDIYHPPVYSGDTSQYHLPPMGGWAPAGISRPGAR